MPPKASVVLSNGTKIEIEGTVEEVAKLTELYNKAAEKPTSASRAPSAGAPRTDDDDALPDIATIVMHIKECDEAEIIEQSVLDQKDVINRVLLCLFIVQKYVSETLGLTSGDIEKITDQLGVKVAISSASTILSGRAKAYVTGDAVRKKGGTVRYRINRRGLQYFETVLNRN
jgi:hypothetical protein